MKNKNQLSIEKYKMQKKKKKKRFFINKDGMIFSGIQSKFKIKSINFIAQVQEIIINWFFR